MVSEVLVSQKKLVRIIRWGIRGLEQGEGEASYRLHSIGAGGGNATALLYEATRVDLGDSANRPFHLQ